MWPFSARSGPAGGLRRDTFKVRAVRWLRRGLLTAGLLALVAGTVAATRSIRHFVYHTDYFTLRTVEVRGASPELEAEARAWIEAKLERQPQSRGRNLVLLHRDTLGYGLSRLPRARTARVYKSYPQTLRVEFVERTPVMLANLQKPFLMDEEGQLLAMLEPAQVREATLPMLTGVSGTDWRPGDRLDVPRLRDVVHAVQFVGESEPDLHHQIVEWNIGSRQDVTAILSSGTEVRFGDAAPLELLDKLSAALRGKPELAQARYVDLRMERQVVWKEK